MSLVIASENALTTVEFGTGNLIKAYKQSENIPFGLCVQQPKSTNPTILSVQREKPLIHTYNVRKEAVAKRVVVAAKFSSLAVSPNNQWLAAGSKDGALYVWNLQSGALRALYSEAHFQPVTSLAWSQDSSVLVSGGADARVLVWRLLDLVASSLSAKSPKHIFTNHTLAVTSLVIGSGTFREARLYTTSLDATCCVYDLFSGNLLYTLVADSKIHALAVDPAERQVYLGCDDGCHLVPLYHEPSTGSKLVAVGTADGGVVSTNSIERVCKPANASTVVTALTLSFDGSYIIAGMEDGSVSSWETMSGQLAKKYRSSKGKVTQLVMLPLVIGNHEAVPKSDEFVILQRNLEGDDLMDYVPRSQEQEEHLDNVQDELEQIAKYEPINVVAEQPTTESDNTELEELKERHAKLQKMYDALWAKRNAK